MPIQILQETDTPSGALGVDPKDIKIASNPDANTIVAMAPVAALDLIGEMIDDLESHEVPERIVKHYQLQHATADEVVEYLGTQFDGGTTARRPQRGGNKGRAQRGSGPRAMNTPTFVAYARLNMVSAQATEEDFEKIDELIAQIDVKSDSDAFVTVNLIHADAGSLADTLSTMFVTGASSGNRRPGRRGGGGGARGTGPKFIGEEGGRILFFSAPTNLHERIHEVIAQVEEQSKDVGELRTIELEHAVPSEVAEAIESAYGQSSGGRRGGRRGGSRGGSSGASFTITAHDPSKRLFVKATDAMFEEIESLAKTLDQPATMEFDFKVYPLQHASARKVYETLTNLVRDYYRAAGGRPSQAFAVQVDDKANALIVLGNQSVFDFVSNALVTIDIPANAASKPSFLMVALKNANAQEVAQNIRSLWNQRTMPQGETAPQVEANRATNTLIVRGTEEQIQEIQENFIKPLDEQTQKKLLTEILNLEHAQPQVVADSINQFFQAKADAYRRIGRQSNVSPLEFTVVVTADADTNQIIVQASEENMEFVKTRVAELDQEGVGSRSATSIVIYPIKYADPNAVVNIINQWSRARTGGGRGRGRTAARDVVVAVAEHATKSVVVTASAANHEIIQELVNDLDNEELASSKRKREVIKLDFANSDDIANQLTQVFRQVSRPRGDRGPSFISNAATNSIVASVNDEELEEIRALLDSIDVESSITGRSMVVYQIKYADPNGVVNAINQTYRVSGRRARPEDQVTAVVEWGTQSVIVTASEEHHAEIEELLVTLDDETMAKGNRKRSVFRLEYASANEMARQLTQAFRQVRGRRGDQGPGFLADAKSNSIIATVNAKELVELEELVKVLDQEPGLNAKRTTKPYPLKYADPGSINVVILNMFRWDRRSQGSPADQVTSAVEGATQSVIVTASEKNHEVIAKLIEQVDVESTFKKKTQLFRLQHASAEDVSRTLTQVLRSSRRGTRRGEVPVSVSADASSNSLVIVASEADMADLLPLIESFDAEPSADKEPVITAYPLRYADPRSLAGAINNAFRPRGRGRSTRPEDQVTVTAENATQSLIVTAVPKKQEQVKAFIDTIDKEGEFVPTKHVVRLKEADAEEVARSLQQFYRGRRGAQAVTIAASRGTNSLLIQATNAEMETLYEVIASIDVPPDPESEMQIKSIRLTHADPSSVQDAINRLFRGGGGRRNARDQVSAVPEWGSRSVIVSASPQNMRRVEALIREIDSGDSGQREVRVINIEHADPSGVARALDQIYIRSAPRVRGGEQPISISEIQGSKAILVKANEIDMERIVETVQQLDTDTFEAGNEVRVVRLIRSDATEMQSSIQSILAKPGGRGGRRGRGGGDLVGDVRISVLTQANAVVISGDLEEVERLEQMIRDMDAEAGEGGQMKIIKLTYANPSQLVPTLQEMFANSRGGGRRGRGQMTPVITANEPLKAILVRASPMDQADILATIKELDVEEVQQGEMFRIIQVPQGHDIDQLADNLERGINDSAQARVNQGGGGRGRGRSSAPSVTINADARSRTLFVTGSASLFDDVEAAVKALEVSGPAGPTTITVLSPVNMDVEDIRRIIAQMKGEGSGSSSGRRSGSSSRRNSGSRSSRPRRGGR